MLTDQMSVPSNSLSSSAATLGNNQNGCCETGGDTNWDCGGCDVPDGCLEGCINIFETLYAPFWAYLTTVLTSFVGHVRRV